MKAFLNALPGHSCYPETFDGSLILWEIYADFWKILKKTSLPYKFFFKSFLSKIFKRSSDENVWGSSEKWDFTTIICEALRKISKKIWVLGCFFLMIFPSILVHTPHCQLGMVLYLYFTIKNKVLLYFLYFSGKDFIWAEKRFGKKKKIFLDHI